MARVPRKLNTQFSVYISWPTLSLVADSALPGDLYICIRHRIIKFRHTGDLLSGAEFNKLIYNGVETVFIAEADRPKFEAQLKQQLETEDSEVEQAAEEVKPVIETQVVLRRQALDLFKSKITDEDARETVTSSKKMVTEFLKRPHVIDKISMIQKFGKGCVDHSVNVAVLSVFLGMKLGYSSQTILEHLAIGGLLHDLGKSMLGVDGDRLIDESDPIFKKHPELGKKALSASSVLEQQVGEEVRMIVAQHHEFVDGSGYPGGLQGLAIYDLARVVAIANVFDNLVSDGKGDMKERQIAALDKMEKEYAGKLDRRKLEKAIKALRYCVG